MIIAPYSLCLNIQKLTTNTTAALNRNESKTVFEKVCETKTDTSAALKRNSKPSAENRKKTKFEERMEKLAPTEEVGVESETYFGI